jgi:CheY-like chemotaxis protein
MEGYEVVSASDGLQAVDFFRATTPDFVSLDVMMARLEWLQGLQADPPHQRTGAHPIPQRQNRGDDAMLGLSSEPTIPWPSPSA